MSRTLILGLAGAVMLTLAGSAGAQPQQAVREICIDPGGRSEPISCSVYGGRTGASENVCSCATNASKVVVPVCPDDVRPPAESMAYERARKEAARDGTLVGDTFQGGPMCIAPLHM
ncbi:MAG: hypothetical protein JWP35_274 [Caulobacter sp.]|jgi:hypothetical protein|nr:hypothetical protein [Caulobacter sp.]